MARQVLGSPRRRGATGGGLTMSLTNALAAVNWMVLAYFLALNCFYLTLLSPISTS
jgi:hypothetical protein